MVALRAASLVAVIAVLAHGTATASVSSSMIVEMRDITSVSVSPDGRLAVTGICYPNPRTNKRELSWVIVSLREGNTPIIVPAGEEIFDPSALGDLLSRRALWSENGTWFFYLRREGEQVQLWETRRDGKVTRQVTHSRSDLIDLRPSADPNEFVVQLAPDRG